MSAGAGLSETGTGNEHNALGQRMSTDIATKKQKEMETINTRNNTDNKWTWDENF
jgi:hypothetical protein